MHSQTRSNRKFFRGLGLALLLSVAVSLLEGGFVWAQQIAGSQGQPHKSYMNSDVILLPIVIDPRTRNDLREVHLFVKSDPKDNWTLADRALPTQDKFVYRAPADGAYLFTVATMDRQGRLSVSDLSKQPPQAVVVVDRKAPEVEVEAVVETSKGQCFSLKMNDANPEPSSLLVEFQTRDMVWRRLEAETGQPDTYCIPRQAAWTGKIRISAHDRCNNKTHREINLQEVEGHINVAKYNGLTKPSSAPAPQAPKADSPAPLLPPMPKREAEAPAEPKPATPAPAEPKGILTPSDHKPSEKTSDEPTLPPLPMPGAPDTPAPLPGGVDTKAQPLSKHAGKLSLEPVPVLLPPDVSGESSGEQEIQQTTALSPAPPQALRAVVKNPRQKLNYKIEETGESGVGKVEIWMTTDQGKSWQRLAEDPDKKSPVEVMLPGEGVFGLTLKATNGLGFGGEPPVSGDAPDWIIEVDTTPPEARILAIDPTRNTQPGWVLIRWMASDKNLAEEPITLHYSSSPKGPWRELARNLKNTGFHPWHVPEDMRRQLYIRLTVVDQAGNKTETQTQRPIQVDDNSRPVVRIEGLVQPTDE